MNIKKILKEQRSLCAQACHGEISDIQWKSIEGAPEPFMHNCDYTIYDRNVVKEETIYRIYQCNKCKGEVAVKSDLN